MLLRFLILFFADDCIIFARTNIDEARTIRDLLSIFEALLEQKINLDKCEVSLNKCLEGHHIRRLSSILSIKEVQSHDK